MLEFNIVFKFNPAYGSPSETLVALLSQIENILGKKLEDYSFFFNIFFYVQKKMQFV